MNKEHFRPDQICCRFVDEAEYKRMRHYPIYIVGGRAGDVRHAQLRDLTDDYMRDEYQLAPDEDFDQAWSAMYLKIMGTSLITQLAIVDEREYILVECSVIEGQYEGCATYHPDIDQFNLDGIETTYVPNDAVRTTETTSRTIH